MLPACREYGVGVIPWSPLSSGLLGGVLGNRTRVAPPVAAVRSKRIDKLRPQLEKWERLCAELGEEPAAVALAWLLHQDGVTCPIIGPRTMDQLDGASLRALDITLDESTLAAHRRDLPRPRRHRPRGLRLVGHAWPAGSAVRTVTHRATGPDG